MGGKGRTMLVSMLALPQCFKFSHEQMSGTYPSSHIMPTVICSGLNGGNSFQGNGIKLVSSSHGSWSITVFWKSFKSAILLARGPIIQRMLSFPSPARKTPL